MNLPTPLEAHGTAITAGILNVSEHPLAYVVKIFPEETARGYAADIVRACNGFDALLDAAQEAVNCLSRKQTISGMETHVAESLGADDVLTALEEAIACASDIPKEET